MNKPISSTQPTPRLIALDDIDNATRLSAQLVALLGAITGEGFETFSIMSDEHQGNVLWLAEDLATNLNEIVRRM